MLRRTYIISILIAFLLTCGRLSGQDSLTVFKGPVLSEQKGNDLMYIFGNDTSYFYTIRNPNRRRDGLLLEKVATDSLSVELSRNVQFPEIDGAQPYLMYPMSYGGRNYLFATAEKSENTEVALYAYEINSDLNLQGEPILLGSSQRESRSSPSDFHIYTDIMGMNMIVVMSREFDPLKNEKFEAHLFDADLHLLRSKQLEVPHESGQLNFEDVWVDGDYSFYMLMSIADPTLSKIKNENNIGRNYALLDYNWESEMMSEKSLAIGVKWIYDVQLLINEASNIQIAGYYSNMIDLIMAGTFSVEIDRESGRILNQGLSPFERDFKTRYKPTRINDPADLSLFELRQVLPAGKDRVQMISEKKYIQTSTVFNPVTGTYTVIRIHNYDEILVTGMNPSSQVLYQLSIPKFQSSTRDEGMYTSFLSWIGVSDAYLIYNDHEKNLGLAQNQLNSYRQLNSPVSATPVIVRIGPGGQMKKSTILNTGEKHMTMTPYFSYPLHDGVILATSDGYKTQYIRLKLE